MTSRALVPLTLLAAVLLLPTAGAADPAPVSPVSPDVEAALGPSTDKICVLGLSKDYCSAFLTGGGWGVNSCAVPGIINNCRTLQGKDAKLAGRLFSDPTTCASSTVCTTVGRCDEVPDFGGELVAAVALNAQRHGCCPGRGSWGGPWEINDPTLGLIAVGDLQASLGVGTHRPAATNCGSGCGTNCERCYDAVFNPQNATWRLAAEGFLDGEVIAGRYRGCRVRASFQGNFTANGDPSGPLAPPNPSPIFPPFWRFCGTINGVLECPCQ